MTTNSKNSPTPLRSYIKQAIPCSLVDMVNRRAAATGSIVYAALTGYANYNGHHIMVAHNDYRGYWVAASNSGEHGVAAAFGYDSIAKSDKTGAIVLINRADDGSITSIFAAKVGTKGIKSNTWYRLNAKGKPIALTAKELSTRAIA